MCPIRKSSHLNSALYNEITYMYYQFLDVLCRPDIINYSLLRPNQHEANLNNAFNIAEESLGITKLLDAEGKCICIVTLLFSLRSR